MRNTAITSALIAKLQADPALMALAPDGVFKNVAGDSMAHGGTAKRFVIVALMSGHQERVFGKRAFQDALYLVEARMLSTVATAAHINDAAARIDELLDPQPPQPPATLTIPNFGLMALYQDEPTEDDEFDDADSSIHWRRAGGRYGVWTQPRTT